MDFSKLFEFDTEQNNSSVEDILAEYRAEERMNSAPPLSEDGYAQNTFADGSAYEKEDYYYSQDADSAAPYDEDEDDVRVYAPAGRTSAQPESNVAVREKKETNISALEDEARRYIAMVQEYAAKKQRGEPDAVEDYSAYVNEEYRSEDDYADDELPENDESGENIFGYEEEAEPERIKPSRPVKRNVGGLFNKLIRPSRSIEKEEFPEEDADTPPETQEEQELITEEEELPEAEHINMEYSYEEYSQEDTDDGSEPRWKKHHEDEEPDIDSRFNLSGKKPNERMLYGSKAVDLSADEEYTQVTQKSAPITHWTEEQEPLDEETERRMGRRKTRHQLRKEREAAREEARIEREKAIKEGKIADDAPFEYAEKEDTRRDPARFEDNDSTYFPPTFKEYLASSVMSFIIRLKGAADSVGGTMVDTQEDLGQEVSPAVGAKYYGSFIRSQKMRLRFAAAILVLMIYISLGLPVPGMLKDLRVQAAGLAAMQLGIMLIGLDVFTNAIVNLTRPKIGADTLAVFGCIITTADALIVAKMESAALHTPLCALSSLSFAGIMLASALNTTALKKTILVPAIGKKFFAVTGEIKLKDKKLTLLKSLRPASGFVRRAEELPPDEAVYNRITPILAIFALLFSIIVCIVHKDISDFVFVFSAVIVAAVPAGALCAFALPYYISSRKLFKSGAAIAGWSGMSEIGLSRNLIVTDRDLFPGDCVELESPEIFAGIDVKTAISYVGTMMCAASSCVTPCFAELMEDNGCALRPLENFEFLSGGGMSGVIDGHKIYCGSTDFISLLRNVSIPYRVKDKTAVFLVVDNKPWGVFIIKYTADPKVRKALVELVRSTRHPVFAVRDFNVTPELLKKVFDLPTDGYDFPPFTERYDLSEPGDSQKSKIAAILCNEGLGPLTKTADTGRAAYVATRINSFICVLLSAVGIIYAFVRLCAGYITAASLLKLSLFGIIPIILVSLYVKTKG